MKDLIAAPSSKDKFVDPLVTADGSERAWVELKAPKTLWFNTGTLCNITCENCYIESSPTNDRLSYLTTADVTDFLGQLSDRRWPVAEIGFTGGEPFMNPDIVAMLEAALSAGFEVLVLTNAMRPMMRKRIKAGLVDLNTRFRGQLTLRVSLDHYTPDRHDLERGQGTYETTLKGMRWIRDNNIPMTVAGRTMWGETDADARRGFADLFQDNDFKIDAYSPVETVLFPEMDETVDVPEITTACWGILNKSPSEVMCASSRMVVKRKGEATPSVLACTLLPYDPAFDLGPTLEDAEIPVRLNHPHCAKFCVLGGASCSA